MKAEHRKSGSSAYEGEPRKASIWIYLVAYVIPYVVLGVIALYWPAHSGPFGLDFTDSKLATMVPSVTAYIEKSKFPHATAAYFVLSAFLLLPYLILVAVYPVVFFGSSKKMLLAESMVRNDSTLKKVFSIIFCLVMVFGAWLQNGQQFGLLPINERRGALAVGGVLFGFYAMLYLWVGYILVIVRLSSGRRSRSA